MQVLRSLFKGGIRLYQICISPLLGPRCRFYPSCSHYALSCMSQDVPLRVAIKKIVLRLSRCHPANPGGVDLP